MKTPLCKCSHGRHRHRRDRECAHRACGCTLYRPDVPALAPRTPRVVRAAVVRKLPGVTR